METLKRNGTGAPKVTASQLPSKATYLPLRMLSSGKATSQGKNKLKNG
jgi:hypothetical protein